MSDRALKYIKTLKIENGSFEQIQPRILGKLINFLFLNICFRSSLNFTFEAFSCVLVEMNVLLVR